MMEFVGPRAQFRFIRPSGKCGPVYLNAGGENQNHDAILWIKNFLLFTPPPRLRYKKGFLLIFLGFINIKNMDRKNYVITALSVAAVLALGYMAYTGESLDSFTGA